MVLWRLQSKRRAKPRFGLARDSFALNRLPLVDAGRGALQNNPGLKIQKRPPTRFILYPLLLYAGALRIDMTVTPEHKAIK